MKKQVIVIMGTFALLGLLAGCAGKKKEMTNTSTSESRTSQQANAKKVSTSSKQDDTSQTITSSTFSSVESMDESNSVPAEAANENAETVTQETNDATEQGQEALAAKYIAAIKQAQQKQIDYRNSIQDPQVRASVQSSVGAATSEAELLKTQNPNDAQLIDQCLAKVLNEQ